MNKSIGIIALLFFATIGFAFGAEVSGNNSIYTFNISNCQADTAQVNCTPTTIRFQCDITPVSLIDSVDLYIEGAYYTTTQNNDTWYYDFSKGQDTSSTTDPISLTKEKIFDLDAGSVNAFETVDVNRTCDVCEATFLQNCTVCNISDQQVCQYTSSNETCNPSYNATETCNYCTPTWTARTGGIYECQEDNTKFVFYDDFASCYSQTGLPSDGPPYDHNTTQPCSFFQGDFNCTVDPEPFLTKKMNILCELPSGPTQYDCTTYVKKDLNSSTLLQTNPEYTQKTPGLLSIFGVESEPRTSFTNDGKNLNAYFTNKNLETYNTFILGVTCSTNTTLLNWEQEITPLYKSPTYIANRAVWFKDNAWYLIVGFIMLIVIIGLIAVAIREFKQGVRIR